MFSRRFLLAGAAGLALAAGGSLLARRLLTYVKPLDPAVRASRIAWLAQNAAPLRSIDIADDDFRDLEAFGAAVGDARIVMLGEQTHGEGAAFLAKARLVRFLHERMGFDVLAFESGLLGMRKVWKRIRDGENARTAARSGLFDIWSRSRQVQPLIDYVEARARSSRPLELAGFDCQLIGLPSRDHPLNDLVEFLAEHGIDTASIPDWPLFRDLMRKFAVPYTSPRHSLESLPTPPELHLLLTTIDVLIARMADMTGEEVAFWRQFLKSTKAYMRLIAAKTFDAEAFNVRDAAMADNLIWLAREAYPQRKIIVWAANFHNMRNLDIYKPLVPMGHHVWQAFGNAVFNVATTTHEGASGWFDRQPAPVPLPSADTLEGLWGETKHENAFVSLRRVPAGGEWLQAPLLCRCSYIDYKPYLLDWSQVVDAVVFLRTMQPSTATSDTGG